MDREIEAIASTCGLIHDLGNPPFGHAGERAVQYWFATRCAGKTPFSDLSDQQQQDFLKFEGNAQTLRLVTRLQILSDFYGLNLTLGTLSAACKYTAASDVADGNAPDHAMIKPGHFASEGTIIAEIRRGVGSGDRRNPITFLVEAADDIVYSVADIEDAIKKDILRWSDVEARLDHDDPATKSSLQWMRRFLDLDKAASVNHLPSDACASAFRTAAIFAMSEASIMTFSGRYDEIMSGEYSNELVVDSSASKLAEVLKSIGSERVYCTHPTLKLEIMGRKVIVDLMDLFWEGVQDFPVKGKPKTKKFPGKIAALLSSNYAQVFQKSLQESDGSLPDIYLRYQFLTDYICGMTDTFAKRLHSELTNV